MKDRKRDERAWGELRRVLTRPTRPHPSTTDQLDPNTAHEDQKTHRQTEQVDDRLEILDDDVGVQERGRELEAR